MSRPWRVFALGDNPAAELWRMIDELRSRDRVTLDMLAERCGCTRSTLVLRRHRRTTRLRLDELNGMARALGYEVLLVMQPKSQQPNETTHGR